MKSINLSLDLFRDYAYIQQDEVILQALLDVLTLRNVQWLMRRPDTPLIYRPEHYLSMGYMPHLPSSGVYYQPEPTGEEDFDSIPKVLRMGSGDCDDLASWRAAELRVRFGDLRARPVFVGEPLDQNGDGMIDYIQYHVMVLRGDGALEDPSAILGMVETPEMIRAELEDLPEIYPEGDDWHWGMAEAA